MRSDYFLTFGQMSYSVYFLEMSNSEHEDEVREHDFDAIVRRLNEATCTIDIGKHSGQQKKNESQVRLEDTC